MSHDTIEVRLIGLPVHHIVKLGGRFLKQLHHHCESLDHTIQEFPNEVIFLFIVENRDPPFFEVSWGPMTSPARRKAKKLRFQFLQPSSA